MSSPAHNAGRYARQESLRGFGREAQRRLAGGSVLVVGAGGLGTPACSTLAAMGVGRLGIADDDRVAASNLHRQTLYTPDDVGAPKVEVLARRLRRQNPDVTVEEHRARFAPANAAALVADYDLVVDASDNLPTRYLVSDACVAAGKPLVYGAVQGFEGQVSVFNLDAAAPTYRCLYPEDPAHAAIPDCASGGVLGVMPGLIGHYQALEAVKVLTGVGEALSGRVLIIDGRLGEHRTLRVSAVPAQRRVAAERMSHVEHTRAADRAPATIPAVEASALDDLLAAGATVLDVREAAEYFADRLAGTQSVPLDQLVSHARLLAAGGAGPVYVMCASGKRSRYAAEVLREAVPELGVVDVRGGLRAYRDHRRKTGARGRA